LKEFFDDTCNGEVVEQDIKPYLNKYKNITIILNPA
jgi:hypothetical protein